MTCNPSTERINRTFGTALVCNVPRIQRFLDRTGLLLMLLWCGLSVGMAQEDLLSVFGTVKLEENSKKLEGARVVVYQDGVEFDAILTDIKGGYEFDLPLRHQYVFSFEYEGYSNKRIEVDASGIPMDVKGARNMDLDMSMMALPPGFDASIFEDLYGKGQYNPDENTVIFDNNYTVRMRNKVQAELARLERMAGQEAEMRAQFDEFVQKGNRAVTAREWQKAVDFYDSALGLFPDDADVNAKRASAQRELDALNAANADEAAFQALLDDAEAALSRDRLDDARRGFEDAAAMRPDASEPRDGLRRVDAREEALANSAEAEEEYQDLINDGDIYFEREQWDRAIDKFSEASALKPNEVYPKNRMEEAQTRQADLAAQQADIIARTIEYEALVDEANLLFRDDDYAAALVKYEAAGGILPAERFWQQRADACRERLAEADAKDAGRRGKEAEAAEREAAAAMEREKRDQYNRINDEADELFRAEDYGRAVARYAEALELFPDERYPQQRIADAEKRLERAKAMADAASNAQNNAESGRSMDAMEGEDNWEALDAAEDVADANADAQRAAREAAESAARSEAERVEEEYNDAIGRADAAFDEGNWRSARNFYESALGLKPGDRYAKSRLERVEREAVRTNETADVRSTGPSLEELERERERLEREMEQEALDNEAAAEALRAQQAADEADRLARAAEERKAREERDRKRSAQLSAQSIGSKEDEVESYFKEALASEALARQQEVEERKKAQAELMREAEFRAQERIDREMEQQRDGQREISAMQSAGQQVLEQRWDEQRRATEQFAENAQANERMGQERLAQGARAAQSQSKRRDRLAARHSQDYTLNIPEVEEKKRTFRDLISGLSRTSADRRNEAREQAESTSRNYRQLGDGASERAQQRLLAARRTEKKTQQRLLKREQEARQRAYNEKRIAEGNLRGVGPLEPEDYQISAADEKIPHGVHEQSYDIPNGLVIERTVRNGNQVVRYRKVVTKTGVYYFRGDRSITADTWRRETTLVLD